ncbi:HD-GYP domain-containing protein [Paenibacillus ginsengarvi]|uniref:HD-GYP domain-containing protein n=1 Tax=Paenibacillus ginsengarvi TaxID=400777 RepID=A0A3B0CTF6_9BACL|nr:HD-GYP domain-containing protein [Paenibacillus ginsengarvi]RKN86016.1 HD-GYP domain-containing protein [Paenibacillus ginsengarvi]
MATISVSQLKIGDKVIEDVVTKMGNVLLKKGFNVSQREHDILRAFLIPSVTIESRETEPEAADKAEELKQEETPFTAEYDKMLQLLKKVYKDAMSSPEFPILDIRTRLEQLIAKIEHYNVLTFTPRMLGTEDYLFHNSIMVSLTSYLLAKWHGFQSKDWIPIALGGLLHDVGNAKVDAAILSKPSKLTNAEVEEMRRHTLYGYTMLKSIPSLNDGAKLCVLQHHERDDGSGYPMGVKGEKIHPYAKVVAVADVFHAMTSNRTYKKAESPYLVLEQVQKESFGKLDPTIVSTFINKVTQFHNGTVVRLSDNRAGEIIFTDRANPTRPMVNVSGTIINLAVDRTLFIQEVL